MDAQVITIVVAEDHQLVRQGLIGLLKVEPDFQLVGEAGDGVEALHLVETRHPDILLLDLAIPRLHGLEVLHQVCRDHAETRVIVVSMHKEECYVVEALRNGAAGYVLKDSTGTDLIEAIRKVKLGRRYLSPSLEDLAISVLAHKRPDPACDIYDALSNRERLVLELAAEGCSSTVVAARLYISPRTAETHRANLMRKLGLRSQTDLVRFAIRKNIISA